MWASNRTSSTVQEEEGNFYSWKTSPSNCWLVVVVVAVVAAAWMGRKCKSFMTSTCLHVSVWPIGRPVSSSHVILWTDLFIFLVTCCRVYIILLSSSAEEISIHIEGQRLWQIYILIFYDIPCERAVLIFTTVFQGLTLLPITNLLQTADGSPQPPNKFINSIQFKTTQHNTTAERNCDVIHIRIYFPFKHKRAYVFFFWDLFWPFWFRTLFTFDK